MPVWLRTIWHHNNKVFLVAYRNLAIECSAYGAVNNSVIKKIHSELEILTVFHQEILSCNCSNLIQCNYSAKTVLL